MRIQKLSEIESLLNEELETGTHSSKNGNGNVKINKIEGGYEISIEFQGTVRDAELPGNAKADLYKVLDELEKTITEKLEWLG